MKTVSKSWLRIRPASCMRLSAEYIAGNSRAGRNSCRGSTTKFSAAASRMMAAAGAQKPAQIFGRYAHQNLK